MPRVRRVPGRVRRGSGIAGDVARTGAAFGGSRGPAAVGGPLARTGPAWVRGDAPGRSGRRTRGGPSAQPSSGRRRGRGRRRLPIRGGRPRLRGARAVRVARSGSGVVRRPGRNSVRDASERRATGRRLLPAGTAGRAAGGNGAGGATGRPRVRA